MPKMGVYNGRSIGSVVETMEVYLLGGSMTLDIQWTYIGKGSK